MLIERGKTYNKVTRAVIARHVDNLRKLDDDGTLALCGISKGWKGVAGMVIFKAASLKEAEELCRREPLVAKGFATYHLSTLQVANKENNYLL